jgi:hypothetical protein
MRPTRHTRPGNLHAQRGNELGQGTADEHSGTLMTTHKPSVAMKVAGCLREGGRVSSDFTPAFKERDFENPSPRGKRVNLAASERSLEKGAVLLGRRRCLGVACIWPVVAPPEQVRRRPRWTSNHRTSNHRVSSDFAILPVGGICLGRARGFLGARLPRGSTSPPQPLIWRGMKADGCLRMTWVLTFHGAQPPHPLVRLEGISRHEGGRVSSDFSLLPHSRCVPREPPAPATCTPSGEMNSAKAPLMNTQGR